MRKIFFLIFLTTIVLWNSQCFCAALKEGADVVQAAIEDLRSQSDDLSLQVLNNIERLKTALDQEDDESRRQEIKAEVARVYGDYLDERERRRAELAVEQEPSRSLENFAQNSFVETFMQSLQTYLREKEDERIRVIFDEVSRLKRSFDEDEGVPQQEIYQKIVEEYQKFSKISKGMDRVQNLADQIKTGRGGGGRVLSVQEAIEKFSEGLQEEELRSGARKVSGRGRSRSRARAVSSDGSRSRSSSRSSSPEVGARQVPAGVAVGAEPVSASPSPRVEPLPSPRLPADAPVPAPRPGRNVIARFINVVRNIEPRKAVLIAGGAVVALFVIVKIKQGSFKKVH